MSDQNRPSSPLAAASVTTRPTGVDVLIQTYNEELNLPHTLESVAGWVNRVFVVDSGSTDRTVALAKEAGATVVHHPWEGYAAQKNWALDELPFESPWVLILDADESVTPALRDEVEALVSRPTDSIPQAGFHVNRVLIFAGQEIRHCGYFPSWNLRLFKRGRARYEQRLVHEHMIVDGETGYLRHLLRHEDRRGLEHFYAKHNRYSSLEAREIFEKPEPWPGVVGFFADRVSRRRFIKSRVIPYMPVPWTFRLIYMYVLRFGFLDGRAGWRFSNFIATYEFLIQSKYQELRRLRGRLPAAAGGGLSEPEGELDRGTELGAPLPPTISNHNGSLGPDVHKPRPVTPVVKRAAAAERGAAAAGLLASHTKRPAPSLARSKPIDTKDASRTTSPDGPSDLATRTGNVPVSVIIPTLNEAANLPRCLDHLQWADEVVVVDSGSGDDTLAIARQYGVKTIDFVWNGQWPKKKNWTLDHAPLKHRWVLIVDADEWIMPDLADEIARAVRDDSAHGQAGFYINRRFIFMGRWIRHCGYYPSWNLRLFLRDKGRYEQLTGIGNTGSGDNEVHEHVIAHGEVGYLNHDMLHLAFPNIHTFVEKHNRYSNWEAAVQFRKTDTTSAAIGTELSKRRRLKNLSRNLPMRPLLRFLYAYVWKGGFLDGRPGYIFCRLLAIYEYLSVAKYVELRRTEADERAARSLSNVPAVRLISTNCGSVGEYSGEQHTLNGSNSSESL